MDLYTEAVYLVDFYCVRGVSTSGLNPPTQQLLLRKDYLEKENKTKVGFGQNGRLTKLQAITG